MEKLLLFFCALNLLFTFRFVSAMKDPKDTSGTYTRRKRADGGAPLPNPRSSRSNTSSGEISRAGESWWDDEEEVENLVNLLDPEFFDALEADIDEVNREQGNEKEDEEPIDGADICETKPPQAGNLQPEKISDSLEQTVDACKQNNYAKVHFDSKSKKLIWREGVPPISKQFIQDLIKNKTKQSNYKGFTVHYNPLTWELSIFKASNIKNASREDDVTIRLNPKNFLIYSVTKGVGPRKKAKIKCSFCAHPLDLEETTPVRNQSAKGQLYNDFNSSRIIPGFYRSKFLGKNAGEFMALHEQAHGKSEHPGMVFSMHLLGYEEGGFHVEEYKRGRRLRYKHEHTYKGKVRTVNGQNPADPRVKNLNVKKKKTVDQYLLRSRPEGMSIEDRVKQLQKMKINIKLNKNGLVEFEDKTPVTGNLDDALEVIRFLLTYPDMPILIHCKGGRHKTGIVSMMLQCLMNPDWYFGGPLQTQAVSRIGSLGAEETTADKVKALFNQKNISVYSGPPAFADYVRHNRVVYRQTNVNFARDLCNGKVFQRSDQIDQWVGFKKTLDQRMARMYPEHKGPSGQSIYTCEPIEKFEDRYAKRWVELSGKPRSGGRLEEGRTTATPAAE